MKRTWAFLIPSIALLLFASAVAEANSGDFSGGVAIGTGYAGVTTAPTNGLIVQSNIGIGTTSPNRLLEIGSGVPSSVDLTNIHLTVLNGAAVSSNSGKAVFIDDVIYPGAGEIGSYDYPNVAWVPLHINASTITLGDPTRGNAVVGIGTATPAAQLHVFNSTHGGDIGIGQQSDSTPYMRLGMDTGYVQYVANNAYWTGSAYNYVNTAGYGGLASRIAQDNGVIEFDTTSGGTNPIGWSSRMYITNGGAVGIGTISPRGGSTLDVNGKLYVATFAAGSSTTVCQNGNVLSSCSSARRFKENIRPSELGLREVLAMKPVTFDFKNHKDNWEKHDFGFVAEDMAEINPLFATYDDKGEINGVRYAQLTAVNAKATQEMQAEIDDLKRTIKELKHQK